MRRRLAGRHIRLRGTSVLFIGGHFSLASFTLFDYIFRNQRFDSMELWMASSVTHMTFQAGDAARILGVPRRKLLFLSEQGIIKPTNPEQGRGINRLLDLNDLLEAALVFRLGAFEIPPRYLRRVVSGVRTLHVFPNDLPDPPPEQWATPLLDSGRKLPLIVVHRSDEAGYHISFYHFETEKFALSNTLEDLLRKLSEEELRLAQIFILEALTSDAVLMISLRALVEDLLEKVEKFIGG
jgi:hypothetical protein